MQIKTYKNFLLFVPLLCLFLSCAGECEQVTVEKAEWITRYEEYRMDTLAGYAVVGNTTTLYEYLNSDEKDEHFHYICVKNTNKRYSNQFAVKFECSYGDYSNNHWPYNSEYTTEYVEIKPNSEHCFAYKWNGVKGIDCSDFQVDVTILQKSQNINLTRRIDELNISKIKINTCEKSAEAEQAKYDAIKAQYLQKVDKEKQIINRQ